MKSTENKLPNVSFSIFLQTTGCRGRLPVLREAVSGDAVQRAQLLRRIRQRGSRDGSQPRPHLLVQHRACECRLFGAWPLVRVVVGDVIHSFECT